MVCAGECSGDVVDEVVACAVDVSADKGGAVVEAADVECGGGVAKCAGEWDEACTGIGCGNSCDGCYGDVSAYDGDVASVSEVSGYGHEASGCSGDAAADSGVYVAEAGACVVYEADVYGDCVDAEASSGDYAEGSGDSPRGDRYRAFPVSVPHDA